MCKWVLGSDGDSSVKQRLNRQVGKRTRQRFKKQLQKKCECHKVLFTETSKRKTEAGKGSQADGGPWPLYT